MSFKEWILPVGLVGLSFLTFYISWALSDPKLNDIPDPTKLNTVVQLKNGLYIEQEYNLKSIVTNEFYITTNIVYYRNDSLITLEYWDQKLTPPDSLQYYLKLEKIKAEKTLIKLQNALKIKGRK